MELSDEVMEKLATRVVVKLKDELRDLLGASLSAAAGGDVPRRMTVQEFAACVNLCEEVVRRRIRGMFIPKQLVEGRRGGMYYIDRGALAKFNVTQEVAAERLRALRLRLAEEAARSAAKGTAQSLVQSPAPCAA